MQVLVCVKRVPAPGARIALSEDATAVATRHLGFTVSPHEECAVEEAVRLVEAHGGQVTVLTLGSPEAEAQLREACALGADRGVLLSHDGPDWDPEATAAAIAEAVAGLQAAEGPFDLLLFGDESADAGHSQVGVRVAHGLGLAIVGGVKGLELDGAAVWLHRVTSEGAERYRLDLPAAVAVREGLNLPRYPSMKGRLRARRAEVRVLTPRHRPGGLRLLGLRQPPETASEPVVLGAGADAAPAVVELLETAGVV